MPNFPPLRTPRIQVEMHELSARDAIALCQMPADQCEYGTTELLKRILVEPKDIRQGQETDIRLWTIQERAFAVAHYLAGMIGGDFQVGEAGLYSDYIMESGISGPPPALAIGNIADAEWMLQPMLGWHAEAIERLIQAEELPADRSGWLTGALAVQVYRLDEGRLDCADHTDAEIDAAVHARAVALMALPESQFMALVAAYYMHGPETDHIFHLTICEDGLGFLPAKEVPGNPPARFHFSMAIREDTMEVFGPTSGIAD